MIVSVWWRWWTAAVGGQRRTLSLLLDHSRRARDAEHALEVSVREWTRIAADQAADHRAEVDGLRRQMADRDDIIRGLDAENTSWKALNAHLHDQYRAEVTRGTRIYRQRGGFRLLAGHPDMPPHLADRINAILNDSLPTLQGAPADD